jgi:hypothetical protein
MLVVTPLRWWVHPVLGLMLELGILGFLQAVSVLAERLLR